VKTKSSKEILHFAGVLIVESLYCNIGRNCVGFYYLQVHSNWNLWKRKLKGNSLFRWCTCLLKFICLLEDGFSTCALFYRGIISFQLLEIALDSVIWKSTQTETCQKEKLKGNFPLFFSLVHSSVKILLLLFAHFFKSWTHLIVMLEKIALEFTLCKRTQTETCENNFCKCTQTETCQNEKLNGNSLKFIFRWCTRTSKTNCLLELLLALFFIAESFYFYIGNGLGFYYLQCTQTKTSKEIIQSLFFAGALVHQKHCLLEYGYSTWTLFIVESFYFYIGRNCVGFYNWNSWKQFLQAHSNWNLSKRRA